MAIATFQTELDNAKAEIEGKDNAIANLENQLSGAVLQLKERDDAIAKLESELAAGGDKQLTLFPGQELTQPQTPENIESPAVNSEPLIVTPTEVVQTEIPLLDSIEGTVSVGGLMEYIRDMKKENPAFPDPPEKTQTFTDAVTGKTNRLGELERLYGFKLVGYVMKGKKREYRYTIN